MQIEPNVLIIADKPTIYGIEKGYYPDLTKAVQKGNILVLSDDDWSGKGLWLKSQPVYDGTDIYLRNPYSNCYIRTSDNGILESFIDDKTIHIKEVLVRLGAKHITIDESTVDKTKDNGDATIEVKNAAGSGSLNTHISNTISVNIKTTVESHDPNRTPQKADDIESYIMQHGLIGDTKLTALLERLKIEGKLFGSEKYTITYLNEVDSALKILASIDCKLFNSKLDFSLEHNNIHKITKSLSIEF